MDFAISLTYACVLDPIGDQLSSRVCRPRAGVDAGSPEPDDLATTGERCSGPSSDLRTTLFRQNFACALRPLAYFLFIAEILFDGGAGAGSASGRLAVIFVDFQKKKGLHLFPSPRRKTLDQRVPSIFFKRGVELRPTRGWETKKW